VPKRPKGEPYGSGSENPIGLGLASPSHPDSVIFVIFLTHFLTTRPPTVALGQQGAKLVGSSRSPMLIVLSRYFGIANAPDLSSTDVRNYFRRRASDALDPHVYKIKIRISVLEHDSAAPPPSFDLRVIPVSLS
jgi:hypothetical protein